MPIISTSVSEIERMQRQEDVDAVGLRADARHQVAGALAAEVVERQAAAGARTWWCAGRRRCARTPAPGHRFAPSPRPQAASGRRQQRAQVEQPPPCRGRSAARSGTGSGCRPSAGWSGRAAPASRRWRPASAGSRAISCSAVRAGRSGPGAAAPRSRAASVLLTCCTKGIPRCRAGVALWQLGQAQWLSGTVATPALEHRSGRRSNWSRRRSCLDVDWPSVKRQRASRGHARRAGSMHADAGVVDM